jgi:DUF1680 family protein
MHRFRFILRNILVFVILFQVSCNRNPLTEPAPSEWHFKGHIGQTIDHIAEQRILDEEKWMAIYPETEEAFRLREDDKAYPQRGQWRGEFWGKYILSAIEACRYYRSDDLKSRIKAAVKGLISCQDPNGYIGTYGNPGFLIGNNWNVWNRKYTLWGLLEAWELLGDDDILKAAIKFTDHLMSEVGPEAVNIVETGNFFGMPSSSILAPVIMLYQATGDARYLDYAVYIVDQWAQHPAGLPDILNRGIAGGPVHHWFEQKDPYLWAKSYEFTSCAEGLVELYKVTGDDKYLAAAKNIHASIASWERSPVGSVSFNDKYVGSAGLINTVAEICDAVYWNRLSFKLFQVTGDVQYIDEFERTLYNALLCAFNPEGDWGLRRLRMSHIHIPAQNHFLQNHQCCTDNLPRGLFQASEMALMEIEGEVLLNLFEAGAGQVSLPSGNRLRLKLEGDFLAAEPLTAHISVDRSEAFVLAVRNPCWSHHTLVEINGTAHETDGSEDRIRIRRKWSAGDKITIHFDLNIGYEFFDTSKSQTCFHEIDFYLEEWAELKFLGGSNTQNNQRFSHVVSLSKSDALPQKTAVALHYGPVVLSRDVRITRGDIFSPVQLPPDAASIRFRKLRSPPGIWQALELDLGGGQIIRFCDFSSAGNTWSYESLFNTWCILLNKESV